MGDVEYSIVSPGEVNVDDLLEFYRRQRHTTSQSPEKIREMIGRSACCITAHQDGRLIGIARGITDGLRGYLTECKLDPSHQGPAAVTRKDGRIEHDEHGIAREMAMRVLNALREAGVERIDATAHGTEEDFLAELGFTRAPGMLAMHVDARNLTAPQAPNGSEAFALARGA